MIYRDYFDIVAPEEKKVSKTDALPEELTTYNKSLQNPETNN